MAYKGLHSSSGGSHSHRGKPYVLILLITFGAALLGVMVLHRLRERRIYNLLVKEKDHQLLALQLLFQKERDRTRELRGKNEEMKAKIYTLRSKKMELARTVVEMQSTMDSLKDEQKLMESAFEENQNELRIMKERGSNLGQGVEILALREALKQKEAEIKDLKQRLKNYPGSIDDHLPTIFPENVTENGTVEAKDKAENDNINKEKDGNSGESVKYGGDDKHMVTIEDASKSNLTKFKDGEVTAEIKDEISTNEKDIEAEVVDGREKKAIGEEQRGQLENNTHRGGKDFNVKQLAGLKRKHGLVSRTKGKHRRTTVKNRSMENNGIFESHGEFNMGNRKVYRDEKVELKDTTIGRDTDEGSFTREDEERDNNNPGKDKSQAQLLNHESREGGNNTKVDDTNHQVENNGADIHPEKQRLDEIRQSEDSLVQQNWNRRHINKTSKNAGQSKPNMFHEEPEELEASDVQKQEKDDGDDDEDSNDDFFKESQPEFEDVKEEYKEEIDESEFHPGL